MRGLPSCDVYVCGDAELTGAAGHMPAGPRPLPEQIADAMSTLSSGYSRVVLVAGDVCGLERQHVAEALRHLDGDGARAAVGRTMDGGFDLAAFNAAPDLDWAALPWFRPTVGDSLIDALGGAGFSVAVVEPLADIDDAGDARRILGTFRGLPLKLKALLRAALNVALHALDAPIATPQRVLVHALYRRPPPA